MNLIDGLNLKGRPAEIPDCSRIDLPQFFVDRGYKVGVEIGVAKGEFTKLLCEAGLKVFGVDPWMAYGGLENDPVYQKYLDDEYLTTKNLLSKYPNCTLIRKSSMEAAQDFSDKSLDFVYIDGDHDFKHVAEDLYEWSKKVKAGGIISGHDYTYFVPRANVKLCHVIPVVNAFTQAYNIENWCVLGEKFSKPNEKRDHWRSFMWIKS